MDRLLTMGKYFANKIGDQVYTLFTVEVLTAMGAHGADGLSCLSKIMVGLVPSAFAHCLVPHVESRV